MKTLEFWISLVGAVVAAFIIAIWVPGKPDEKVLYSIEYAGLVITFLLGFMILAGIASGKIDISRILEEKGSPEAQTTGGASMSRFQLLIFTFVIAISFFLIVVNTHKFPDNISPQVLTLLGISASTYAVSKGIQAGAAPANGSDAPTGKGPAAPSQTDDGSPPVKQP
jgi:hypothetical protein